MKYNTRFNPTISGQLHVGHLYMALVNEAEAHRSGGEFIVRVDDVQPNWCHWIKEEQRDQYYLEYQEQLSKFMHIDAWYRQSTMPKPREIVGDHPLLNKWRIGFDQDHNVEYPKKLGYGWNGYSPLYLVNKVILDYYTKTTLLIRGENLIGESSLYEHFLSEIGLLRVYHIYLPHLETPDTNVTISKTRGGYTIQKQLDAFGVEETLERLRDSCLVNPNGEFFVSNIKSNPVATGLIE